MYRESGVHVIRYWLYYLICLRSSRASAPVPLSRPHWDHFTRCWSSGRLPNRCLAIDYFSASETRLSLHAVFAFCVALHVHNNSLEITISLHYNSPYRRPAASALLFSHCQLPYLHFNPLSGILTASPILGGASNFGMGLWWSQRGAVTMPTGVAPRKRS